MSIIPVQLKHGDYYNIDPTTGYIGNGQRDPGQPLDIYLPSSDTYARVEAGGTNLAGLILKNSACQWRPYITSSGHLQFQDDTSAKTPLLVEKNCLNTLMRLYASGKVGIGGALSIGSGGQLMVTAGTYNGLNVADTSLLLPSPSSGGIVINDLAGSDSGHILIIANINTTSDTTLTNASGSNEQFRIHGGADMVFNNQFGSALFISTGDNWFGGHP